MFVFIRRTSTLSRNHVIPVLRTTTTQVSSLSFSTSEGPKFEHQQLLKSNRIRDDPAQQFTLKRLQHIFDEIVRTQADVERVHEQNVSKAEPVADGGWFGALSTRFGGGVGVPQESSETDNGAGPSSTDVTDMVPRGIYIHGGPGSGKTFCMDLLYHSLPLERKRRVHFHEFMLEVHRMLHTLKNSKQTTNTESDDIMERCVDLIHKKSWVLCFDEFQVTDIADAMILRRLFESLWERGTVVIATSNREPDELYKNGIQRHLFVPFIESLKVHCRIENMQSDVDYRMLVEEFEDIDERDDKVYFTKKGKQVKASARFERMWTQLAKDDLVHNMVLHMQGRGLNVPMAGKHTDIARFTFEDLCCKPLGAADYYAIASAFHTVFLEKVPQLKLQQVNQIRRFITLVDTLYDQHVVLVISADVAMDELLDVGEARGEDNKGLANIDEIFAFDRTLSRLHEMQKSKYLSLPHKTISEGPSPVRFLNQFFGATGGDTVTTTTSALSEGDIRQLWDRYDVNEDGEIDASELEQMLKEITLFKSGHMHVSEEVVNASLASIADANSGVITWMSFRDYFLAFGIEELH